MNMNLQTRAQLLLFLGLFSRVSLGYVCDDGCVISDSYVGDGYCDCLDCGEETWTCASCSGGCPDSCGQYRFCNPFSNMSAPSNMTSTLGESTTTLDPEWKCDDGCEIHASYRNDDWCDCSQCEDEPNWTCFTCGGCPVFCGVYTECVSSANRTSFICDSGCELVSAYVGDDWCDCEQCEDESNWDCQSCGGCPQKCGGSVECEGNSTDAKTTATPEQFICEDNCTILAVKQNDGFCDCGDCEDESAFNCSTCGGCPALCGHRSDCGDWNDTTQMPLFTTTEEPTQAIDTTESGAVVVRLLLTVAFSLLWAIQ